MVSTAGSWRCTPVAPRGRRGTRKGKGDSRPFSTHNPKGTLLLENSHNQMALYQEGTVDAAQLARPAVLFFGGLCGSSPDP